MGIDSVLDLQGGTVEHVYADHVFLNDLEVLG